MNEGMLGLRTRTVSCVGSGWSGRINGFRCAVRTLRPATGHGMARRLVRWRPVLGTGSVIALHPAATAFVFRHLGEQRRQSTGARILVQNRHQTTLFVRQLVTRTVIHGQPPGPTPEEQRQPARLIRAGTPPPAPRPPHPPSPPTLRASLTVRHIRLYVHERIHQPHLTREPRPAPNRTPNRPSSPAPEAISLPHRTRRPPLVVRTTANPTGPPVPHPGAVRHPDPRPPQPAPPAVGDPAPPPTPDLDRLTDQVLSRIERRAIAQRERFGRS
ncbi:hypothetical protein GCM10010094_76360 [Streptomyces flaveus]|uniref:Uncharacterized protein n=1 Tax=Streptomyces flaveus TaxID=66370 RepID=A0A917VQK0_9ACTN|nr:hypothetical protein GCM10010094_76360 [Streptomyces flaveus]